VKLHLFQWSSLKARVTLFTLAIFILSFCSLAFYGSWMLRDDMQRQLSHQQYSTVSLLAEEINQQLTERLNALQLIAASISPALLADRDALQKHMERHQVFQAMFNGGTFVTDTGGTAIADVPLETGRVGINYMDVDTIAAALTQGRSTVGRPVMGRKLKAPLFGMSAPVYDEKKRVIGAVYGVTNLGKPSFLDRIAANRYGKTGGYLLVAPQHRLIVTASDKQRIMTRIPNTGNAQVEAFLNGAEGSAVLVNPLGVEVLASVKKVPVAGWFVAASLPSVEAFAPLRAMQQRRLLALAFLTLLVAGVAWGLTWWMLRRQLAPMLEASRALNSRSVSPQPAQPLPVLRNDEIGELIGAFNQLLEILQQREASLRESESRWKFAIEGSGDGVWDWNLETDDSKYSPRWKAILGYADEDALPSRRECLQHMHPDDLPRVSQLMQACLDGESAHFLVECRCQRKDAQYQWVMLRGMVVQRDADGKPLRMIGTLSDISERKAAEAEIHRLAYFDALTRLPNRRLLLDRLSQALAATARSGQYGALFFVDLDNFKTLNDSRGHDVGDLLLVEVAHRLKSVVREGDTVARQGGDEFVVLMENLGTDKEQAAALAKQLGDKLRQAVNQPFNLNGYEFSCKLSIGVGLFDKKHSIDDMLKHADLALYQAKNAGRNKLRFFDPEMQATMEQRSALVSALREAVERQQLCLYYQPQVDTSRRMIGVEALLRWQHPQFGLMQPNDFIPLAEDTSLILPIGLWVLQTACAQLKVWEQDPRCRNLQMAVNVSARQFRQQDFVAQVKGVLEASGVNPARLKLELTESMVLDNIDDTIRKMLAIKQLGVSISMDDFGSGYSSLSYLAQLPLDQLKIDLSFVRNVPGVSNNETIARTIITMGLGLAMDVIAEGVETEAQRDFLEAHGCHVYQGFLFSQPLPVDELQQLLLAA
jgi:diguanylate cyclase (GGDEF)-like protein/PAS domain S-box-containing protein